MSVSVTTLPITAVTTPSGEEKYPVGSWMLPSAIRPQIHAFYRFARAADDIADDRFMLPEQKLARLFKLDPLTLGRGAPYARRLIAAYKCDAVRNRTANWQDLVDYCALSAVPVGRFLLDLHDVTDPRAIAACDSLCIALQVMYVLRDIRNDRLRLNRIYLPMDWLREAGLREDILDAPKAGPEVRKIINRALDQVDHLLSEGAELPRLVKGLRLRIKTAIVVRLGKRLARRLRYADPLANPNIQLTHEQRFYCAVHGLYLALLRR